VADAGPATVIRHLAPALVLGLVCWVLIGALVLVVWP
jgi:hypothetical protein